MPRTFDELVAEADAVSVAGWDFSWLDGRATEQRPTRGYQRLLRKQSAQTTSGLDLHTGGGEALAGAGPFPPTMAPPSRGRRTSDELLKLHRQIEVEGALVTHSSRVLIEARKL
jgi:hypothetical protein